MYVEGRRNERERKQRYIYVDGVRKRKTKHKNMDLRSMLLTAFWASSSTSYSDCLSVPSSLTAPGSLAAPQWTTWQIADTSEYLLVPWTNASNALSAQHRTNAPYCLSLNRNNALLYVLLQWTKASDCLSPHWTKTPQYVSPQWTYALDYLSSHWTKAPDCYSPVNWTNAPKWLIVVVFVAFVVVTVSYVCNPTDLRYWAKSTGRPIVEVKSRNCGCWVMVGQVVTECDVCGAVWQCGQRGIMM